MSFRRWLGRLHIVWLQKVRKRSDRFDRFNDPVFEPIDLSDQSGRPGPSRTN